MGRKWRSVDRWYFEGRDAMATAAEKICRNNVLSASFTLCKYTLDRIYVEICRDIRILHVRANVPANRKIQSKTCCSRSAGAMMIQLQNLRGSGGAKKCYSPETVWEKYTSVRLWFFFVRMKLDQKEMQTRTRTPTHTNTQKRSPMRCYFVDILFLCFFALIKFLRRPSQENKWLISKPLRAEATESASNNEKKSAESAWHKKNKSCSSIARVQQSTSTPDQLFDKPPTPHIQNTYLYLYIYMNHYIQVRLYINIYIYIYIYTSFIHMHM